MCPGCHEEKPYHAKGYCRSCYVKTHKRPPLIAECSICHCKKRIAIKSKMICTTCNARLYREKTPGYREKHAREERERRARDPEAYREYERRRSKTKKRKEWSARHSREYYQRNREKLVRYQRQWRKDHPKKRDSYKRTSIRRRRDLPNTLTEDEWAEILEMFNHSCAYCQDTASKLEEEHIVPVSKGGGRTMDNIVPSCHSCNSSKGTLDVEEFIGKGYAKNPHPMLFEYLGLLQ